MSELQFRVHPAVGIARVGNSEEFLLSPESPAGLPLEGHETTGGLPIRPGTEDETIVSTDLRDAQGRLKRQAARFRVFAYPSGPETYPRGDGQEVRVGDTVGGKVVTEIVWTVHVANKKANTFVLVEDPEAPQGISGYEGGKLPPIRNTSIDDPHAPQPADKIATLNGEERVRRLQIDPGPRTISGLEAAPVAFDARTPVTYYDRASGSTRVLDDYPRTFPVDGFDRRLEPAGAIDTLGELRTDEHGRLIVLGGFGRAVGWELAGEAPPLEQDVNNDQWFDDTSDGPVEATLVFEDGTRAAVHGAWVCTTDPSYAPQILNVVSLWDDVYDVWVRELGLEPELYDATSGGYRPDYQPGFEDQVRPIFRAAALAQWTTNLSPLGISAHRSLDAITADTNPATTPVAGLTAIFRDPDRDQFENTTLMPLALGDANESMLAIRRTQQFFLRRWDAGPGHFRKGRAHDLGAGEALDRHTLVNCLGGRFSPGIDLTFVVRDTDLYDDDWRTSGAGPFRIRRKPLDYAGAGSAKPLLSAGYVPLHVADGLEPGDLSKFMAVPWHTDYNSCATHLPSPNPQGNRTLFWSWPAQRPVAVYAAADLVPPAKPGDAPQLGEPRWSVRGPGTDSAQPQDWGRFQPPVLQMVDNWHRIGVVVQDTAVAEPGVPTTTRTHDQYLEVQSQLLDTGRTPVVPYPNLDASEPDPRRIFHAMMNGVQTPEALAEARTYAEQVLRWAEGYMDAPGTPDTLRAFEFTPTAFQTRLDRIYQDLVDEAAQSDPAEDPVFRTREDVVERIVQLAPFDLCDGAWLRNIGKTGPIDEVRALLYSISMDELGDGDTHKNHCNIYLDLCHSAGFYPFPIDSIEFAQDPRFLDSAFQVSAFELAISQFTEEYLPELLGMTLQLEWEVVDLKPTRDLLEYWGFDAHFYIMHIGIDNAVNGHGQRARDAVLMYLNGVRSEGGDEAVQAAWRRIWTGFVAFGSYGTFGQDLNRKIQHRPSLRAQVLQLIRDKAKYGSSAHQDKMVGPTRIDEWFGDPPGFLDALREHGWITPGDWANSRLKALTDFETGPMFRVFTDDELQLWADYTNALGQPPTPPPPPPLHPARAMAVAVDDLRPIQRGLAGHATRTMAGPDGVSHPVAWWFERPTAEFLAALASPEAGLVTPGQPEQSPLITSLIAPTGPMGSVFDMPAKAPNTGSYRDVVVAWVQAGCPLPLSGHRLRLNSPTARWRAHPTGVIQGMGTVH